MAPANFSPQLSPLKAWQAFSIKHQSQSSRGSGWFKFTFLLLIKSDGILLNCDHQDEGFWDGRTRSDIALESFVNLYTSGIKV